MIKYNIVICCQCNYKVCFLLIMLIVFFLGLLVQDGVDDECVEEIVIVYGMFNLLFVFEYLGQVMVVDCDVLEILVLLVILDMLCDVFGFDFFGGLC